MSETAPKVAVPTLEQQKANVEADDTVSPALKAHMIGQIDGQIAKRDAATAESPAEPEAPESPEAEKAELENDAKELEEKITIAGIPMEEAVKDPELFKKVVTNALGKTVASTISDTMMERLRTEKDLNKCIEEMNANGRGAAIEKKQENIDRFMGIFQRAEARAAAAAVNKKSANPEAPAAADSEEGEDDASLEQQDSNFTLNWRRRMVVKMGIPAAAIGRLSARLFKRHELIAKNSKHRLENESEEDYYNRMKAHAKTTAAMGALALLGGAAGVAGAAGAGLLVTTGLKGASLAGSVGHGVWQARRKDPAGPNMLAGAAGGAGALAVGFAGNELVSHHAFGIGNHTQEQGGGAKPEEKPAEKRPVLTPEQVAMNAHKAETDFLNTNGRVRHDFNNITPDEYINVAGDKDHFAGYTALHDQYAKSPTELTAQVQQIQSLDHGFALNDFPRNPGESNDSYFARLNDAMYGNQDLHDKMTNATLDYIQKHGQPLHDLTQSYGSSYLVMENGKPVVKWDDYVSSSDPNDKVLMLSETKGIRFPCGQPIELKPVAAQQPAVTTTVSHAAPVREVVTSQPPVVTEQPPTTTPPTEVPPTTTPPTTTPPTTTPPTTTPPTPEVPTPKSSDINDWQRPGTDGTTDSGTGVKPRVTAEPTPAPAPVVEQTAPAAPTRPNVAPVAPDSSSSAPGSEAGLSRPGGSRASIGGNSGSAHTGTSGSVSNGAVSGPAA